VGIVKNDEIVFSETFGVRNQENSPVTKETLFPVGSVTKSFTSFLLAHYVDQGLLDWDKPIIEDLPHFRLYDPYVTHAVTLRDLLTHRLGLPRHDAIWYNEKFPREEIIKKIRYLEPIMPFRQGFFYQNLSYVVAAYVLEYQLNKTWEQLTEEVIFNSLNMHQSSTSFSDFITSKNYAKGNRDINGEVTEIKPVDVSTIAPAGGIYSNLHDQLLWIASLTRRGDGLISSQSFDEIFTSQITTSSYTTPLLGLQNLILMESYGLGWFLMTYKNHLVALHPGQIEGYSSIVAFLPKENISLVVLCNKHISFFPHIIAFGIIDILSGVEPTNWQVDFSHLLGIDFDHYEAGSTDSITEETSTPPLSISAFTGNYSHPGYGKIEIKERNGKLEGFYNKIHFPLKHWKHQTFIVTQEAEIPYIRGMKVTFYHNEQAEIDQLSIPFEPSMPQIFFAKDDTETTEDLVNYCGTYSYCGIPIYVSLKNGDLIVEASGYTFHLIHEFDNTYSVIDWDNYTVKFFFDEKTNTNSLAIYQNDALYLQVDRTN
jgi:CubicO group peptidase (beta-lactamase class C family)